MNSRRISQTKRRWQIAALTLLCIALLVLVPTLMRTAASAVVSPVIAAKDWFLYSTNSFPQYLRNRSELVEENNRLRSELVAATGADYSLRHLLDDNQRLRGISSEEESRIVGAVLASPEQLPYDTIMIDRGSRHGIMEGAPVFIGDNTIIGVVRSSAPGTALVELITSSGFESTVFIMGPDIYTNAVGVGGGQMRVGVPQGIPLSEGDLVVLPSIYSGVYGEVSYVLSEPTRPEQYGFVSPEIPLSQIRYVSVGPAPMESVSFEEAQEILERIHADVFTVPVPEDILVDLTSTSSNATGTEALSEESAEE